MFFFQTFWGTLRASTIIWKIQRTENKGGTSHVRGTYRACQQSHGDPWRRYSKFGWAWCILSIFAWCGSVTPSYSGIHIRTFLGKMKNYQHESFAMIFFMTWHVATINFKSKLWIFTISKRTANISTTWADSQITRRWISELIDIRHFEALNQSYKSIGKHKQIEDKLFKLLNKLKTSCLHIDEWEALR